MILLALIVFSDWAVARQIVDQPIVITKAKQVNSDKMVFIISGDGGVNSFIQQLADSYAAQGMPVVTLNSFKYFWKKKMPQETANDIAPLLTKYSNEWQKKKIILCGYSFGADVAPFIYRRLPQELKNKISLVQLLSPASFTDFEIHLSDMLGSKDASRSMSIQSELKTLDVPVFCYYGNLEKEKPLTSLKKSNVEFFVLEGDHHYKNSFDIISKHARTK